MTHPTTTTETAWTEGPWRAEHTGYYWHVVSPKGTITDVCPSQFIGSGTIENPNPMEEANARLISAAPEMADALKWVRTCYRPDDNSDMVKAIDAALSKAGATS